MLSLFEAALPKIFAKQTAGMSVIGIASVARRCVATGVRGWSLDKGAGC